MLTLRPMEEVSSITTPEKPKSRLREMLEASKWGKEADPADRVPFVLFGLSAAERAALNRQLGYASEDGNEREGGADDVGA